MIHPNSISNIDQFIGDFIKEFEKGLPGSEAQQKMAPSLRDHSNKENDPNLARDSSVLILFYQNLLKKYLLFYNPFSLLFFLLFVCVIRMCICSP
jgi:hypothetical protein